MVDVDSSNTGSVADLNSRANLTKLLDDLGEHPEQEDEIRARIEEIFSQDRAIFILDMSGFTRTTQRAGIITFLLMIHNMQRLCLPVVEKHGGILINTFADNLTCIFDDVPSAITASKELTTNLLAANVVLPSEKELYVAIGIGWGTILNVANEAIYGTQVNLASKLGEDIAELGEILLTEAAYGQIEGAGISAEERVVTVSGIELPHYSIAAGS
ncbi:MAG TPA: adenylate/guanylate cyclase domain-containing protein [Actinomycetota bacterium]|nr:adenylate/guanylate cyclase domain-containing protein [Actinomycetota bacterium]